jgi:hypothetical protein
MSGLSSGTGAHLKKKAAESDFAPMEAPHLGRNEFLLRQGVLQTYRNRNDL